MSSEPLPKQVEEDVARFAQQRHLSRDEAVLSLIKSGIEREILGRPTETGKSNPLVAKAMRNAKAVRGDRSKELARLSDRDSSVGELIGFLGDEPDVVAAIREANSDRRSAMYGSE